MTGPCFVIHMKQYANSDLIADRMPEASVRVMPAEINDCERCRYTVNDSR